MPFDPATLALVAAVLWVAAMVAVIVLVCIAVVAISVAVCAAVATWALLDFFERWFR